MARLTEEVKLPTAKMRVTLIAEDPKEVSHYSSQVRPLTQRAYRWYLEVYIPGPNLRYNGSMMYWSPEDLRAILGALGEGLIEAKTLRDRAFTGAYEKVLRKRNPTLKVQVNAGAISVEIRERWPVQIAYAQLPRFVRELVAVQDRGEQLIEELKLLG
jgi:hypothetical protein